MTLKQAAQAALDVQDAVNLSGIVFSFADAMAAVCHEAIRLGEGTAWKNHHPIAYLFTDKIASLVGHRFDGQDYFKAADECRRLADD